MASLPLALLLATTAVPFQAAAPLSADRDQPAGAPTSTGAWVLGGQTVPGNTALGTTELTLRDLTEGYTAFANGGVKVESVMIRSIEDKDGHSFFHEEPRRREVLSPETASLMTYILEGVVQRGTATCVKAIGRPVAGKTGTTNDQRDAWFLGYTPDYAVGVWIGFDRPQPIAATNVAGGSLAAPVFGRMLERAGYTKPSDDWSAPPPGFARADRSLFAPLPTP